MHFFTQSSSSFRSTCPYHDRDEINRNTPSRRTIANESVPIHLAQCRFPGLAISNAKILIRNLTFFKIKYTEAILSNSTRKLLWFEITKMLIAVAEKNIVSFIVIFGTLSLPTVSRYG